MKAEQFQIGNTNSWYDTQCRDQYGIVQIGVINKDYMSLNLARIIYCELMAGVCTWKITYRLSMQMDTVELGAFLCTGFFLFVCFNDKCGCNYQQMNHTWLNPSWGKETKNSPSKWIIKPTDFSSILLSHFLPERCIYFPHHLLVFLTWLKFVWQPCSCGLRVGRFLFMLTRSTAGACWQSVT